MQLVFTGLPNVSSTPFVVFSGQIVHDLDEDFEQIRAGAVVCGSSDFCYEFSVIDNEFRALLHFENADALFELELYDSEDNVIRVPLDIKFQKRRFNGPKVKIIYLKCRRKLDDDSVCFEGEFESPFSEDTTPGEGCKKLSLGCAMIQAFYAGNIEKTFDLELDSGNFPVVHEFVLPVTFEHLSELNSRDMWRYVANQIMNSSLREDECKYLAFASFSRYSHNDDFPYWDASKQVRGYVAHGGADLAVLSTHCLFTWPSTFDMIQASFSDSSSVNRELSIDDSDGRSTLGGCYATTLGATIHELSHVFNLAHSSSAIMSRGYTQIQNFFLTSDSFGWFSESEIAILKHHKWFQDELPLSEEASEELFSYDEATKTVTSENGIAVIEYRETDEKIVKASKVFSPPVDSIELEEQEFDQEVFIEDVKGNIFEK